MLCRCTIRILSEESSCKRSTALNERLHCAYLLGRSAHTWAVIRWIVGVSCAVLAILRVAYFWNHTTNGRVSSLASRSHHFQFDLINSIARILESSWYSHCAFFNVGWTVLMMSQRFSQMSSFIGGFRKLSRSVVLYDFWQCRI